MSVKSESGYCRAMRILTIACFLHFSGLNNGYTYLANASPLSAAQSFSLVSLCVRDGLSSLASPQMAVSLDNGRQWITVLALNAQILSSKICRRLTARDGIRLLHALAKSPLLLLNGFQRTGSYLSSTERSLKMAGTIAMQEFCLKEKKEIWTGSNKRNEAFVVSGWSALMRASVFNEDDSIRIKQWLLRAIEIVRTSVRRRICYQAEEVPDVQVGENVEI